MGCKFHGPRRAVRSFDFLFPRENDLLLFPLRGAYGSEHGSLPKSLHGVQGSATLCRHPAGPYLCFPQRVHTKWPGWVNHLISKSRDDLLAIEVDR